MGDVATDSSCMQKEENIELGNVESFSNSEPACLVKGSEETPSTRPDDQSAGQHGGCDDSPSAAVDKTVMVALVLGGMDTNGEIFDDCLVMRLNDVVECAS